MDQVKQVLSVLNAQKFWVACGLLTLLPVGVWFMAKSALDAEFKTRKGKIDQAFSTANAIIGIGDHPNTESAKGMDENISKLKKSVFDAWQAQYEEQKQILVWPSGPGELRPDFIAKVDPLRPIEEKMTFPTPLADELRPEMREEYRDYIKAELPKLARTIGAQWGTSAPTGQGGAQGMQYGGAATAAYGGGGARSMTGQAADAGKYIVQWDAGDQARLRSQFDWSNTQDKLPQTLDILYAQEDLWILNAVMNIIKRTNRDATASYDATIKELKYVQLGTAVQGAVGSVIRLSASVASEGGPGEGSMDMYGPMGGGDAAGPGGAAQAMGGGGGADMYGPGSTGASASRDPADLRYVDNNYVPLPASRVRTALSPDGKSPDDAFLVVAKRVPIRLGLTMDQRRIHRLVTECGNSTLMVEVRQVRINRQSPSGGGGGDGGSSTMYGGSGGESGGGFGGGGFGGGGFGGGGFGGGGFGGGGGEDAGPEDYTGGGSTAAASIKSSYDLPVELYGVIYIYNPVAEKKLGIELKEADPSAAPEEPAEGEPLAAGDANGSAPGESDVAAN